MELIVPVGQKLIIRPLESKEYKTEGGIFVADMNLQKGEVMAVSQELKDVYNEGDKVIIPLNVGISLQYKGKSCIWVNSQTEIYGIVNDK